ncbi:arginase family protein [Microbacterium sp. RD1]|uniref:arginase family protein n=1 Tax=Microbacterium sp. RD1 TaxID=3457313 RepID=UPI003FA5CAB9
MTRFVVVPQWQGSPAARAMLLRDGAEAIAGDLPRAATVVLDVPLEAGDAQGTRIHRLSALRRIAASLDDALAGSAERAVVVGGDCSVSIPAAARHAGDDLAIVWVDAHADINDAETSPSGSLAGMALRALVGGVPDALPTAATTPDRVVLVGARDRDAAEDAFLTSHGVTDLSVDDLADPEALARAVRATGASRVYVHIDLDVLDPAEFTGSAWGVPFGLGVANLVAALQTLRAETEIVGATIAGFAPASPAAAVDDLGSILRLVGAVA